MKKKNIGVIGCGKWGKKIIKELKKISNIRFVYNSKDDYQNFEKKLINTKNIGNVDNFKS